MLRSLTRKTIPLVAFGVGLSIFPPEWRKSKLKKRDLMHINEDVLSQIEATDEFKTLSQDPSLTHYFGSEVFPEQHKNNYVASGLLYGPELFEIDPLVFLDSEKRELTGFYYLGNKLISQDGQIHNGIVSTLLDEGLCSCGFPLLPTKKGVTASLSINFKEQAEPDTAVVLRAKVIEAKGRKVVINGYLETLPFDKSKKSKRIADSVCVLVEPKWFGFFTWFNIF